MEHLIRVGINPQDRFDGLGLLVAIPSYREPVCGQPTGPCEMLYQFYHLSCQEFLAAQRIEQLAEEEQRELLVAHRKDRQSCITKLIVIIIIIDDTSIFSVPDCRYHSDGMLVIAHQYRTSQHHGD